MWNCPECNRIMHDDEGRCNGCGLKKPSEIEMDEIIEQRNAIEQKMVEKITNPSSNDDDQQGKKEENKKPPQESIVQQRINVQKRYILKHYNLSGSVDDYSEQEYEELIKYIVPTIERNIKSKSTISIDKLANSAYIYGNIVLALLVVSGLVLSAIMESIIPIIVYLVIGIIMRLFVRIVGRIVELLNEINEKV